MMEIPVMMNHGFLPTNSQSVLRGYTVRYGWQSKQDRIDPPDWSSRTPLGVLLHDQETEFISHPRLHLYVCIHPLPSSTGQSEASYALVL